MIFLNHPLHKNFKSLLIIGITLAISTYVLVSSLNAKQKKANSLNSQKDVSDFYNLCISTLNQENFCEKLNQKLFQKKNLKSDLEFDPITIGIAPNLIDPKVKYILFNDPNNVPAYSYCYFIFRGWIKLKEFSPDDLATFAHGFSILNEDILDFKKWISKNPRGLECKNHMESISLVKQVDLETLLKKHSAIIGINPYASIREYGADELKIVQEIQRTIYHERIHVYHALCPSFEKWSIDEWQKLSVEKKEETMKKYPTYNWSNLKIAGREYIAYLHENAPDLLKPQLLNCKI